MGRFRTEKDSDYYKVVDDAINAYTWAAIVKLQERGVVGEVLGPVGQGKEAKIILARRGDAYAVLKVFYPVPVRFVKSRYGYILGDPRFRGLKISDQLHLVETWCRKEFGNLARAHAAGVRAPKPYGFYRNVLAMEFIGVGKTPAPQLVEVGLDGLDDPDHVLSEVLKSLERTYVVAGLVHGDLSPFNILYDGRDPWIIDWGSAVRRGHPKELEYLRRDVERVVEFFGGPAPPEELFKRLVERGAWRGPLDFDGEGWLLIGGRRLLD
ncbi:serine protein kinase RIO [Pyrobaculum neutrophilum]|uniref:non-specific serine/threonine protein kinase n=1 Tax=Pyrobaculum neutrophilum (strain DSM 2338 / JCM 9278 / NBRC 100436 / V24Sta) TaxID=444157 RepID=B1YDC6_PYRNV|nr:serine protein kinase RIO [Pyrobaculum neutrophilum]ACB39789.1 Non-specific serine/threonine protein kinase [Pyrobaculum neutrophilum V24Sta]